MLILWWYISSQRWASIVPSNLIKFVMLVANRVVFKGYANQEGQNRTPNRIKRHLSNHMQIRTTESIFHCTCLQPTTLSATNGLTLGSLSESDCKYAVTVDDSKNNQHLSFNEVSQAFPVSTVKTNIKVLINSRASVNILSHQNY